MKGREKRDLVAQGVLDEPQAGLALLHEHFPVTGRVNERELTIRLDRLMSVLTSLMWPMTCALYRRLIEALNPGYMPSAAVADDFDYDAIADTINRRTIGERTRKSIFMQIMGRLMINAKRSPRAVFANEIRNGGISMWPSGPNIAPYDS